MSPQHRPAPLLAIETSTEVGSVAVGGRTPLGEMVLGVQRRHAESIIPAIESVLAAAGIEIEAIGGVVVGGGPGSFTGLRVAAATAKGIVRALEVPLLSYSGLMALAASCGADGAVCAMFDARRGEVYAAVYRVTDSAVETLVPPAVGPVERAVEAAAGHDAVHVGQGAIRYGDIVRERGGRVLPAHRAAPRASALLWLARIQPDSGRVDEPARWEPDYLRPAGATRGVKG